MTRRDRPHQEFQRFMEVVVRLRKECPWDREQTHQSIRHSLIEETYEVVEAIDNDDPDELKRELGDLMLHVALHSVMAGEEGSFTVEDVLSASTEKLIRRHPHVFGTVKAGTSGEVKSNWEKIKMSEGRQSLLDGIPKELPSLLRAHRTQDKVSKVGFDWKEKSAVWEKVNEEINELKSAEKEGDREAVEEEFGDLLFSLVNYARFLRVNPELALKKTTEKFTRRFRAMEREVLQKGKTLEHVSPEEMDELWNEEKRRSG